MPEKTELVVEGKTLSVSNLNKVLYPKVDFTKGQVIDYYIRIAPVLLPHLRDRPLRQQAPAVVRVTPFESGPKRGPHPGPPPALEGGES